MNSSTDRSDINATLTSKQREDIMYARLAAKEARIEAEHQRYLELMAPHGQGTMSPHGGREHQHHYTATSPTTGAVTDLDFCADCGTPREPLEEGVYVSDWGDVVDTVSDRPRG